MAKRRCSARSSELHPLAEGFVQRAQRFVEQQHRRLGRQGAGERDTLLLPAGKLLHAAVRELVEADGLQHRSRDAGAIGGRRAVHLQAEGDVLGHAHVREQAVALEHHAQAALVRRQAGDVAVADHDPAGVGPLEAGDQTQCRRFAAPGRAQQRQHFAGLHVQLQWLQHLHGAKTLADPVQPERRRRPGHRLLAGTAPMIHSTRAGVLSGLWKLCGSMLSNKKLSPSCSCDATPATVSTSSPSSTMPPFSAG